MIEVENIGRAGGSARGACSECGELLDVPFLGRASVALEMWVEGSGQREGEGQEGKKGEEVHG